MKRITYLTLSLLFFNIIAFAQKKTSLEKANEYLATKGEVIFSFKANNQAQFLELNKLLSVSHKHVDQQDLEVEAYANKEQFAKFLTYGLAFTVTTADNEIPQELTQRKMINGKTVGTWDTTWDAYPNYSEYVAKLNYWATTYPSLCTLVSIGTTPLGRELYVLKISDNATADETEPEFLYTSSMHGDEITGYPVMLRLIDYLLTNYGSLSEVTNLVNGTEIFINPLANPDGSYKSIGNDIFNPGGATNTPTRANANGVDLNRNYADAIGGLHNDTKAYQPETLAFMSFEATRNFVLAANYHGGTEVFNFPWDTSNTPGTGNFSYHPHDNYFKYVSQEYASLCQTADGNLDYMDAVYNSGQFPGTTNGAAWYSVYGGRQDYNNFFNHSKESTIEVSNLKTPAAVDLPFFWDRNRQALLNYMKQASYGLQGVVTNTDGNPIHAKVYVSGTADGWGSWVETSPTKGDYHKVQKAGTYNVIFEAPGYTSQTISVTLTDGAATIQNVTMVPTTTLPVASNDVTICQGQTTTLTATGSGTIKWYDSINATTEVATGTSFTTPALSTTTSYYAESEVTPANVGPTNVAGAASTSVANRYLIFNCTTPTKLKSVLITASAAGEILVELRNSSGAMLESKVVRLTASGSQDIALDFFLPVATGLRLVSREISGFSLTRANSGITYPMTNGTISITGNSGTGTFFQFFNWKFEPVKSNREEVIVTVNPTSVAGTISANQEICSNSQPTDLTLSGNVGTIQWQSSTDNITFTNISGETSNTLTSTAIGPLTATKYFRAVVTSGVCSSATSATATISVNSVTWNGTAWSNVTGPTSTTAAIIAGNYNVSANINACTLTINNNAVVTIPSEYNVTLNGALTVSSGSFTLENNANLIQTSNAANTGNIIVKRNSSALLRLDYTLWSSPVTNNTSLFLQSFSPATSTNRFYNYGTSTNQYTVIGNPSTTNFSLGKGYLIRMPNDASSTVRTNYLGVFTGVPNNGIIPITMSNGGVGKRFNLIGNPYPSPISMAQFVADNNTTITGTLYFWRKTNNAASPSYCSWVGGVFTSNGESQVANPNGIIQTGQGFFVEALNSATSVSFNNGQRITNNANQFFKTKAVERSTIWLNATNTTGSFSQMAVSYVTGATQGVDDFDGKYYNDGPIALNSVLDNTDYVIQGRALPFDGTDEVPLSFKATNAGEYSIAIDHVDGLFSGNQDIILKDNETGIETNLKTGNYTFTTQAGTTSTRFSLKYQKTLGTNTVVFDENSLVVFKNNGKINIKSNGTFIDNVKLYDTRGRLLFEKTKVNANETSIESAKYANQVLIVQITSNDNKVVNKKVAN